ncbi:hypothetical protein JQV27_15945 [Sulfitobacter mediterraneus]|uniref:hypothetical protein n=1 Tax=Sulfitobacter mediterraneus TaxID=83219 RepID=UPI00193213C0|nr:hypothetical protein [Sulfitobacter mediterraneus]MBM1634343.1 hypothetical protein [Sulfitobacter mediterraneus]MBM1642160.1 hypothetical protein [Sulfitobacter mediterraneus]MBM1646209.1 hypothetical protein [Sulfitobacter mediterraneus]MBM1650255.1 hypothetical protein [Sulfitobacter mediterraneus]MBM1654277.1 hypothetical protein [Sulfitobacter mediterraneus]
MKLNHKNTALAATLSALLFAQGAIAETRTQAVDIKTNALTFNALTFNALTINRLALNRLALNRLALNRLALNRLALNRLALNGFHLNDFDFDGSSSIVAQNGRLVIKH